jgi:uncharacterized membrane protein
VSVSTEGPRIKREHLVWAAAGVIIVVLGVALAVLIAQRNNSGDEAQLLGQSEVGGVVAAIGPLDGTQITPYIAGRQPVLQKASGERAAVVSVDHYTTETEARAVAGKLQVIALLAAPPGGAPSVVTGDMAAWAQQQRQNAAQERDQTQELLRNGVDDPEYRTFYQQEVARLNKVLGGIDPKGKVVFGLVVQGPATDLQALAKQPGVRLLDVASSAKVSDRTEYRGIRPEQNVTVNQHDPRPF